MLWRSCEGCVRGCVCCGGPAKNTREAACVVEVLQRMHERLHVLYRSCEGCIRGCVCCRGPVNAA